ncbi:MAG TPA: type II 3-dehydroquinate dehydratase [Sphingomicrobium sp.]|jgi:3-dehydroquinate dehydratase-2|nr:type II 3-dehydroquinate dehydratase [Sphingomicrobium sp.]
MTTTIFVLNGPNLNRLGRREPEIYGTQTLDGIAAVMTRRASELGMELDIRQSNHEGHLIDWLHEAEDSGARAVILNPGGYGHTSVALHDAVKAIATPVIEVHISDPDTREPFRHVDLVALAATRVIKGAGAKGYLTALDAAARL